jgi:release factor glutamine methyltransferase
MTVATDALARAVVALRAAGCVFAEDEADVLGSAAADEAALEAMVRRRAEGEPLEQVVGFADFCGVRVRLRPGVFVPRVRSELLVRRGAAAAVARPGAVVVDLCCGSGALGMAVHARAPRSTVYAADSDPTAVACAKDNLGDRVYQGDLFDALPDDLRGRVDVLLANVPYVATRHLPLLPAEARDHEPRTALDGGHDGLDVFRRVIAAAAEWLRPATAAPYTPGAATVSPAGGAEGMPGEATAAPAGPAPATSDGVAEAIASAVREAAAEAPTVGGAAGEPLTIPDAAGEPLTIPDAAGEPLTIPDAAGEPAVSVAGRDRPSVSAVVLAEITEAQIDAAVAVVESAGLRAEIAYDEDLEATVIIGHR